MSASTDSCLDDVARIVAYAKIKGISNQAILMARFPIASLNKVEVRDSPVEGKGVFAKRDIAVGDLITLYPCDFLTTVVSGDRTNGSPIICEYVAAPHLSIEMVDKARNPAFTTKINEYTFNITDKLSAIGHPDMIGDSAYLGHMCNDGGYSSDIKTLSEYITRAIEKGNAIIEPLWGGLHLAVLAAKPIKAGDEVLIAYGPEYWMGRYPGRWELDDVSQFGLKLNK